MSDLIDRQMAIDALDTGLWGVEWDKALATAMLKDLPSAERKGHWEKKWHKIFKEELPCCSECNNFMAFTFDYCPNCGARMDGE